MFPVFVTSRHCIHYKRFLMNMDLVFYRTKHHCTFLVTNLTLALKRFNLCVHLNFITMKRNTNPKFYITDFYSTFIILSNCCILLLQTFYNTVPYEFRIAVPQHKCSNLINLSIKKFVGITDFGSTIM